MGAAKHIKFFIPYPYNCLPFPLFLLHTAIKRISFHVKKKPRVSTQFCPNKSTELTFFFSTIFYVNAHSKEP